VNQELVRGEEEEEEEEEEEVVVEEDLTGRVVLAIVRPLRHEIGQVQGLGLRFSHRL
jgi:hypothetical protein